MLKLPDVYPVSFPTAHRGGGMAFYSPRCDVTNQRHGKNIASS